jgi:hypothetical protein
MASVTMIQPAVVAQTDIQALIGVRNQLLAVEKCYRNQAGALLKRLLSGATVEVGPNTAEVEHLVDGGTCLQRLLINGVPC